jgi:hypothetical protein
MAGRSKELLRIKEQQRVKELSVSSQQLNWQMPAGMEL